MRGAGAAIGQATRNSKNSKIVGFSDDQAVSMRVVSYILGPHANL